MRVAPNSQWIVLSEHLDKEHGYGFMITRDMSAIECYDAHIASHATGKPNHKHSDDINSSMQAVAREIKSIYGTVEVR